MANVYPTPMCGCGYPMDTEECNDWHGENEWSQKRPAQVLDLDTLLCDLGRED